VPFSRSLHEELVRRAERRRTRAVAEAVPARRTSTENPEAEKAAAKGELKRTPERQPVARDHEALAGCEAGLPKSCSPSKTLRPAGGDASSAQESPAGGGELCDEYTRVVLNSTRDSPRSRSRSSRSRRTSRALSKRRSDQTRSPTAIRVVYDDSAASVNSTAARTRSHPVLHHSGFPIARRRHSDRARP